MRNTIKVERAKLDMTQEDLANKIGVSRQTIFSIEKGKFTPSILIVLKMAEVFNAKVEDFFWLEEEELAEIEK